MREHTHLSAGPRALASTTHHALTSEEHEKPREYLHSWGPRSAGDLGTSQAQDFYMRYRSSLTQLLADVDRVPLKGGLVENTIDNGPPPVGS
jgi:hypothetical protein